MNLPLSVSSPPGQATSVTDVYTNLHGLQGIKREANDEVALKKVAQQFESMFISMMMKNMRAANAVFEKDSLFNSQEGRFYRDLLDQQQALTMAHGKGLGIAEALYRQMSRDYGRPQADSAPVLRNTPIAFQAMPKDEPISRSETIIDHNSKKNTRVSLADSPEDFIAKIAPYAKRAAEKLGIDKAILMAQAALETGWGKYVLANNQGESSNNLFNIKRGESWKNDSVKQTTLEYEGGLIKQENAEFRVYESITQSFDDFIQFITGNERYKNAVNANDDETFIKELHIAGYATDPKYSDKVLSVYKKINTLVDQYPGIDSKVSRGEGGVL